MITEEEAKRGLIGAGIGAISAPALLMAISRIRDMRGASYPIANPELLRRSDIAKLMTLGATLGAGAGYMTTPKLATKNTQKKPIDSELSLAGRLFANVAPYHSGVYGARRGRAPAYDSLEPTLRGELSERGVGGLVGGTLGSVAGAGLGLLAGPRAGLVLGALGGATGAYGGQMLGGYNYNLSKAVDKIQHREGRKAGLVMSGMHPRQAEKIAMDKASQFHYDLGRIMANGFLDGREKEANRLAQTGEAAIGFVRGAQDRVSGTVRRLREAPERAQKADDAYQRLAIAGRAHHRSPKPKTKANLARAETAAAEAAAAHDRSQQTVSKANKALGAVGLTGGAYAGTKLLSRKTESEDQEKQSSEQVIYTALQILDNAGVDLDSLHLK